MLDFLYAEYKSPFERQNPLIKTSPGDSTYPTWKALIKTPPMESTYPTWKDNAFLMTERRKNNSGYGMIPITLID